VATLSLPVTGMIVSLFSSKPTALYNRAITRVIKTCTVPYWKTTTNVKSSLIYQVRAT